MEEPGDNVQEKSNRSLIYSKSNLKYLGKGYYTTGLYHLLSLLAWCYESNVHYEGKVLKTYENKDFHKCVEECESKGLGCQGYTFQLYSNLTVLPNSTSTPRQYFLKCKLMNKIEDTVGRDRESWKYDNLVSGRKNVSCISNEGDLDASMNY